MANETIVIGAHYDHLGYGGWGSRARSKTGQIHNGADDNATGTAAVMELARRFATGDKKPRRRLVFIAFSGEERGLVGSLYYVNKPLFPLKDTVAMINFDMIGMLRNNRVTVTGTASAKPFAEILKQANKDIKCDLRTPAGEPRGSDQFWFYRRQVPAVHFFTGLTDLYHKPEDDFETINVEGMVQVIDLSEKFVAGVAASKQRPKFVRATNRVTRPFGRMPYLGVVPDLGQADGKGVVIDDVSANSPAAKAGFKPGDRIVKLGNHTVTDLDTLTKALRAHKPKDKVKSAGEASQGRQDVGCHPRTTSIVPWERRSWGGTAQQPLK